MPTIKLNDNMTVDIEDAGTAKAVVDALSDNQAKIDSLKNEVSTLSGKADALKIKVDELAQSYNFLANSRTNSFNGGGLSNEFTTSVS